MLKEQIFKANDIRGVVTGANPELDLDGARRLGAAFVDLLGLSGETFVTGRDMRQLGEELAMAFADGARRAGASIIHLGLTSTDLLWFGSGHLGLPGVQFTASHNPARYNGMKFCLAGASPVHSDFTADLRERAKTVSIGDKVVGDYEERVYFSPGSPDYSIVGAPEGAEPQELDYPDDTAVGGQVSTTFTGNGGPSVGNVWNKLLYSIKFGSTDLFFSSQTNEASQILYDRDPLQRVAKVAPYLTLEQSAYPAVVDMDDDASTPKRLVWVVDAYTTTNNYPYAQHEALSDATVDSQSTEIGQYVQANKINYMRNSVKAVVDAYDGSVRLFRWDESDPILRTWEKIYPGSVESMSAISGDLMSHLRYPEDMFKVQRNLLATYHVTDAAGFYSGGDRWRLAEETSTYGGASSAKATERVDAAGNPVAPPTALQPPYYLTMQMPGQDSAEFSLTSVFVPGGGGEGRREAMAGFLAVDSETGNPVG